MADGMFSKLMELADKEPPQVQPTPPSEPPPDAASPRSPVRSAPKPRSELAPELEDLTATGYTSHSYRFTQNELRWLQRFCLDLSLEFDTNIGHNLFIRVLLRVAQSQWTEDPKNNSLRTIIESLPRK